jgi:uncharacterized membrane-anchored protein YhcB (DUF1043 family)
MNGWWVAVIIALVLGVIVGNLLLLKQTAKFKVPKEVIEAVKKRKEKEAQENKKKPTDD